MSLNVVNLSGQIERINWQPAGQQANGRFNKFPRLSALIAWADMHIMVEGSQIVVGNQKTWIDLSVPKTNPDQRVQGITAKHSQGAGSFLLSNGTFSSWAGNQGVKFELKANLGDLDIGRQALASLNTAMVKAKVTSQQGPWLMLEERYLNPLEQDPNKRWKSRFIPVYCAQQFANLVGHDLLVIGKISVHTPVVGQDRTVRMTPYLHIVASEIHACLG